MQIVIDTDVLSETLLVGVGTWLGTLIIVRLFYRMLRPLFRVSVVFIFYAANIVELFVYTFVRLLIILLEQVFSNNRSLRSQQRKAKTYKEWYQIAQQLDENTSRTTWAHDLNDWTAEHYSWRYLEEMMEDLKTAREEKDVMMAVALLQLCLRKNVGGIFSSELYSHLHTGEPKKIVTDFVNEVVTALKWASDAADPSQTGLIRELLSKAVSTYGRFALCLSGGAMMGNYHLGIVQAYKNQGILPKIIAGSSMGSIIAAFTCTRTDEEFDRDMKPEIFQPRLYGMGTPWSERIQKLIKTGAMWDRDEWLEGAKWFTCGEMTFLEAYEKTGHTLCISLSTTHSASPPILLNHITAPGILIYSAIVASASAPSFLPPAHLVAKNPDGTVEVLKEEYFDGSMEQDIPKEGLAEQLNCQFFVVAQANPQLVPFQFYANGTPGCPPLWVDSPRGGHFLSGMELFLKMDMKNRLRFLNTVGAHKGGLATAFTQDLGGSINIVPPFEAQDFPKAIEQPSVKDLYRYFQGGNYAAFGSIAMITLQYQVARAIEECRKSLEISDHPTIMSDEVERLIRPTFVVNKAQRKTAMVRHSMKRKTLKDFLRAELQKEVSFKVDQDIELDANTKASMNEDMSTVGGKKFRVSDITSIVTADDVEGDDELPEWIPLKYNTRGSLWQGAVARPSVRFS